MSRPNLILIQSDSMDGRVLGCLGHPAAVTPTFDRLAAEGFLFGRAYCNSPICVPSRASMWSGRYPHEVEAWNNDKGLADDARTFATTLQEAGYRYTSIGRIDHYSGRHTLANRLAAWTRTSGVTLVRGDTSVHTSCLPGSETRVRAIDWQTVDATLDWIAAHQADDEPFLLHVGFHQPHPMGGYNTSRRYLDAIDPDAVTVPPADAHDHPAHRYMRETKRTPQDLDVETIRAIRRHYFAMVYELDTMVGEIIARLETSGLMERSIVIYTSDHGELNMEHGQWRKSAMYEGSVRVPLIFRGPGIHTGLWREPVSLIDLYPTLMELAGVARVR